MKTVHEDIKIEEPSGGGDDARTEVTAAKPPALMKHTIFNTPILNFVTRFMSNLLLKAIGWREAGETPKPARYVLIAAPHTSNWDLLLLIALAFRFRVKLYWMGKDNMFKGWYSPFVRFVGGIPIDRSQHTGMVAQTIELLRHSDRLVVTIPAEGTRRKTEGWKSGFYHIALGADVPVVLGFLDYKRKTGGFGPAITLSGDIDADMAVIADFYADIGARHPEKKTEPRLLK